METGKLLRATRRARGLDQAGLARRAGTTQTYVSRLERGEVSPSVRTLERLFHAMGCRLTAAVEQLPAGNADLTELRRDLQALTAAERVDQAITLSEFLTGVAAGGGNAEARGLQPRELLATLERAGVEFVVIGGFALAPHGYVRATKDLDIVPSPTVANRRRLAVALVELDAAVAIAAFGGDELGLRPDERGLAAGGNWVLQTRHGRLDVMQDVPGLRDHAEFRARSVVVDGVHYAGYDDLISMKVASGRVEDLRDIGALEAARSGA